MKAAAVEIKISAVLERLRSWNSAASDTQSTLFRLLRLEVGLEDTHASIIPSRITMTVWSTNTNTLLNLKENQAVDFG